MANKATKVSSNLVLNGSASYPLNILGFDLKSDVVAIKVRETEKVIFTLKAGDEVDGVSIPTLKGIFDILTAFSDGGGTGEGVQWEDVENKPLKELTTPIIDSQGLVPVYTQNGQLPVGMPEFPENAVPLLLLDVRLPIPPETGTFVLRSVNGIASWVAE